jgi:putative transposase
MIVLAVDNADMKNHPEVHNKLQTFAGSAARQVMAFGRYIIMPDHIHCFVHIAPDEKIGTTVQLLKRALSSVLQTEPPHWQPGFFDHVLRHAESYSEKWNYVLQNPVRAGLVKNAEERPFQGSIVQIRY